MAHILYASLALWLTCFLFEKSNSAVICKQQPVDVIFMLDGSRSMLPANFNLTIKFVKDFVNSIEDLGPELIQIGVIQYASDVVEEVRLNSYADKDELQNAISNIKYLQGGTMTGEAMKYLVEKAMLPSHGCRVEEGVPLIVIITTDGKSQDYFRGTLTTYQRLAKKKGAEIFAIGIGRYFNEDELVELGSEPSSTHVFHVVRFEDIERFRLNISALTVCDEDECALKHDCQHICTNTFESYECRCRLGYRLEKDGRSCILGLQPRNLRFTNITHVSSRVHWDVDDVITDDVYFVLAYIRTDGFGDREIIRINGSTTTLLTGLVPSAEYRVELSAVTTEKFTSPIADSFTTLALGSTVLTLANATLASFVAIWTPAGGDGLTGYEVTYQKFLKANGNQNVVTASYGPDVHRMVVTGREPNTNYEVRVVPRHGLLKGFSSEGRIRTLKLVAPYVTIDDTTLSTLRARWMIRYNYQIRHWSVNIYAAGDQANQQSFEIDGNTFTHMFRQLQPNTKYYVSVQGYIDDGGKQFVTPSGQSFRRTKMLKKPKVTVTRVTPTSLGFKWKELNVVADSWRIRVTPKTKKKDFKETTTGRNELQATFTNLYPDTMYKIEVYGNVTDDGQSFESNKGNQKARTKHLTPPSVEIVDPSSTSLRARWNNINIPVDLWLVRIYLRDEIDSIQSYKIAGNLNERVFDQLQPDTTYRVAVYGRLLINEITFDGKKGEAEGRTLNYQLTTPVVRIVGTLPTSLRANWDEINRPVDSWHVVISRSDGADVNGEGGDGYLKEVTLDRNLRIYNFDGLYPNTIYVVEVTGNLDQVQSGTGSTRGRTEFLIAPSVEIIDSTTRSLRVRWSTINIPVNFWWVRIYLKDGEEPIQSYTDIGGDLSELSFNQLQPNTDYRVAVSGRLFVDGNVFNGRKGEVEGTTLYYHLTAPAVRIDNVTPTSFRASWDRINYYVNSWNIVIKSIDDSDVNGDDSDGYMRELSLLGIIQSHNFGDLFPDTKYVVEVTGKLIDYPSSTGSTQQRTKSLTAPNVQITDTTFTTVTARWTNINTEVDRWRVSLQTPDGLIVRNFEAPGNENEIVFNDVNHGATYLVRVVGLLNIQERTVESPAGEATAVTQTLSPPVVRIDSVTPTSLRANWNELNHSVSSWNVAIRSKGEPGAYDKAIDLDGSEKSYNFTNLAPNTDYVVTVMGQVAEMISDRGQAAAKTESLIGPSVLINETSFTRIQVRWSDINVDLSHPTSGQIGLKWRVRLLDRESNIIETINTPGLINTATFNDLDQGTRYRAQVVGIVRSSNAFHESPRGEASTVTKHLTRPIIRIDNITPTSLRASWDEINYPVNSWTVVLGYADRVLFVNESTLNRDQRNVTFDNLTPDTAYTVGVSGRAEARSPLGSQNATSDSLSAPRVEIAEKFFSKILINWTDINAEVSYWRASLLDEEGNILQTFNVSGADPNNFLFNDLTQETRYSAEVVGIVKSSGAFHESSPGEAETTTKHLTRPIVRIDNITPTSLRASWDEINHPINSWNVVFRRRDDADANRDDSENLDGNIMSKTFSNLIPGTDYIVEVRGQKKSTLSPFGRADSTTDSLTAPRVEVINVTYTTMSLRWTAINIAVEKWKVDLLDEDDVAIESVKLEEDQRETIFNELDAGATYNVAVYGLVRTQDGLLESPSGETSGTTTSLHDSLISPPFVECVGSNLTSVTLEWSDVSVTVTSWRVDIFSQRNNKFLKKYAYDDKQQKVLVGNLFPQSGYTFHVTGVVEEGDFSFDLPPGTVNCSTDPLEAPEVLMISLQDSISSLYVTWRPINYPVDFWEYEVKNESSVTVQNGRVNGLVMAKFVAGLRPNSTYTIILKGVVTSGTEEIESPDGKDSGSTDSLAIPVVVIDDITPISLRANWEELNYPIDVWSLFIIRSDAQNLNGIPTDAAELRFAGDQFNATFQHLHPNVEYIVEVVGYKQGFGSQPGRIKAVTKPFPTPSVVIVNRSVTSLRAQWGDNIEHVTSWILEVKNKQTGQIRIHKTDAAQREMTLDNLAPDTQYTVEVVALFSKRFREPLRSAPGVATGTTMPLSTPVVKIPRVGVRALYVEWEDINIPVDAWTVSVTEVPEEGSEPLPPVDLLTLDPSERNAAFVGLKPATSYTVKVFGHVGNARSGPGTATRSTDLLFSPEISISNSTFSTLSAKWLPVNEPVDSWRVALLRGGGIEQTEIVHGNAYNVTFENLLSKTLYGITVQGILTVEGEVFRTPVARDAGVTGFLPATSLTCAEETVTNLIVTLADSNIPVESWIFEIYSKGEKNKSKVIEIARDTAVTKNYVINDLHPQTTYLISLRGRLTRGNITYTTEAKKINCSTSELTFPSVSFDVRTPVALVASWSDINHPVESWSVRLFDVDEEYESSSLEGPEAMEEVTVNGSQHTYKFTNLVPGTYYRVDVHGNIGSLQSAVGHHFGETRHLYTPRVSLWDATTTTISVIWKKINAEVDTWTVAAFEYDRGRPEDFSDPVDSFAVPGNTLNATFTNLSPSTLYRLQVTGNLKGKASDPGQTEGVTRRLSAPIVDILYSTLSSLTARWRTINIDVSSWLVVVKNENTKEVISTSASSDQRQLTFENLDPQTRYIVEVTGVINNTDHEELKSPPGSATGNTKSLLVPIVEIPRVTSRTLGVTWGVINAPVDSWTVSIREVPGEGDEPIPPMEEIIPSDRYSYVFVDLHPGTQYTAEVIANVGNIKSLPGRATDTTEFLTAPDVRITDTTFLSFSFSWGYINAVDVDHWKITLLSDEDEELQSVEYAEDGREFTFEELEKGTTYNVQVAGVVRTPAGLYSSPPGEATATTRSLISIAGPSVECVAANATSLVIEWSNVNADVTSWAVKIISLREKKLMKKYTLESDQRAMVVSDILPQSSYAVRVTGSAQEEGVVFTTETGVVNCSTDKLEVPEVTIVEEGTTFNTLPVLWSGINVPVNQWSVELWNSESGVVQSEVLNGTVHEWTFNLLDPETFYTVVVRGVINEKIKSPFGKASYRTEYLLGPGLSCIESNLSSITVQWADIGLSMDSWTLETYPEEVAGNLTATWDIIKGNTDQTYVITDLKPELYYIISIHGLVIIDNKTYTTEDEREICNTAFLPAPNVTFESITPTSLRVRWSGVGYPMDMWSVTIHDADRESDYDSFYSDSESTDPPVEVILNGSQRTYEFTNLLPGNYYDVDVYGKVDETKSPTGNHIDETSHLSTTQIFVWDTTTTTITVLWEKINAEVETWTVTVYQDVDVKPGQLYPSAVQVENFTVPGNQFNATVTNLLPNTPYHVQVNGNLRRRRSDSVQAWASTKPILKPSVYAYLSSLTSLSVGWSEINANVSWWNVTITNNNTERSKAAFLGPEELQITFEDLDPQTAYTVRVIGVIDLTDDVRIQSPPGSVVANTKSLLVPIVKIPRVTSRTLEATWGVIDVPVDSWTVSIREVPGEGNEPLPPFQENSLSPYQYSYVFVGLIPDTHYTAEVIANVGNIKSSPGQAADTTESLTVPDVRITDTTFLTFSFRWGYINAVDVEHWKITLLTAEDEVLQVYNYTGETREFTIENLEPGTSYNVLVVGAVRVPGGFYESPPGKAIATTWSLDSSPAPNVDCVSSNVTSFVVEWDGASGYVKNWTVRINLKDGKRFLRKYMLGKEEKQVFVENLLPQTEYTVYVTGNAEEQGQVFRTKTTSMTCSTNDLTSPAVRIDKNRTTFSTLPVQWGNINVPVDEWSVELWNSGSDLIQNKRVDGTTFETTFVNLDPDTLYRVTVAGILNAKDQEIKSPFGLDSSSTAYLLSPVLHCMQSTADSITVAWVDLDQLMASWKLKVYTEDSDTAFLSLDIPRLTRDQNYTITDLNFQTDYVISITGHLTVENSTYVAEEERQLCTTNGLSKPIVAFRDVTPVSLTAYWSDINYPVDQWLVTVESKEDATDHVEYPVYEYVSDYINEVTVNGSKRSAVFSDLSPSSDYVIEVASIVGDTKGPAGNIVASTSELDQPYVDVANVSVTSFAVYWSKLNAPVETWTVSLYNHTSEAAANPVLIQNKSLPGNQLSTVFNNLHPDGSFVVFVTGHLKGASATGDVFTTTVAIYEPEVEVYPSSPTSLEAEWYELDSAVDSWTVVLSQLTGVNEEEMIVIKELDLESDQLFIEFDSLRPGTTYAVEVRGNFPSFSSPPGRASGSTEPLTAPVVEVQDVAVTSFRSIWKPINEEVKFWSINVTSQDDGQTKHFETNGTHQELLLEDLKPQTPYSVKVVGVVQVHGKLTQDSPPGFAYATTDNFIAPVVEVIRISPTTLYARWSDVNAPVEQWVVTIQKDRMSAQNASKEIRFETKKIEVNRNKRSIEFDSLMPDSLYIIKVIGVIGNIRSPPGTAKNSTSALTSPEVEVTNSSISTMTIQWGDINHEVALWFVEVSNEDIAHQEITTTAPAQQKKTFTGLKPGTLYNVKVTGAIRVSAETVVYSPAGKSQGSTDELAELSSMKCTKITATTIRLFWKSDDLSLPIRWRARFIPENKIEQTRERLLLSDPCFENNCTYEFHNLMPASDYVIVVEGLITDKNETFSTFGKIELCVTAPEAPLNLRIKERGITHLFAEFTPFNYSVDLYQASCTNLETNGVTIANITDDFIIRCFNLDPVTEYTIAVWAFYKNSVGNISSIINTTLVPPPFGLTLLDPTTSSLLVEWQHPDVGPVDRYYVTYNASEDIDIEFEVNGSQNTMLLTNLTPDTAYSVQVQAEINSMKSNSEQAIERTLEEIIHLQIDDVGYTSINVSWTPSTVPQLKSYSMVYTPSFNRNDQVVLDLPTDVDLFHISNLHTATEYEISINAKYARCNSKKTKRVATTLALPPIGPLTFDNITDSSFVVRWIPPQGVPKPTRYIVTYYARSLQPITVENIRNTYYQLDDLSPATLYNVTVSAVYRNLLESHPIMGQESTNDITACSCATYVRIQDRMQSLLIEMMEKIDVLSQRVEELSNLKKSEIEDPRDI